MKQQLLLLKDVDGLGKKGEVVTAKPGFIRNFLLPQGYAVAASSNMLRKQERLKAERAEQAVIDKKESEALAKTLEGMILETRVKVDPEGHMYGSVSAADIALLFQEQGMPVDKKYIQVTKPIKVTGVHTIALHLKEDVKVSFKLNIIPEGVKATGLENVVAPLPSEEEAAPIEEKTT